MTATPVRLSRAEGPLLHEVDVVDESGRARRMAVPIERSLTLYLDRHELVTLMTLGQWPEMLALGWLLHQRIIDGLHQIDSVQVDWEVGAAAVTSRGGIEGLERRLAHRIVTTGCGQGTVHAQALQDTLAAHRWPDQARSARLEPGLLQHMLETVRAHPSVHRVAGSVHASALFRGREMLLLVEDVGRHNALDTLGGWMAHQQLQGAPLVLYTTGRLTSEMVVKALAMGIPIAVSRNGVTAAGLALARDAGLTLVGRAGRQRFLCYSAPQRLGLPADPVTDD